jgi:predicted flap endonuclease-1-like 5' DNA nuclease
MTMKNKKELQALDELVSKGQIIEAFDYYFADNVTTRSENGEHTTSKKQKRDWLTSFFNEMSSVDEIILHDHFTEEDSSHSKFTFVFTNRSGEKLRWHEIISRKWKDGKVVDEFYSNGSLDDLKKSLKEKEKGGRKKDKEEKGEGKKEKDKKEEKKEKGEGKKEKEEKKDKDKKHKGEDKKGEKDKKKDKDHKKDKKSEKVEAAAVPEVKAKAEPVAKAAPSKSAPADKPPVVKKTVVKKNDDLKIIEGIGPKIEEILKAYKITSFAALAKSEPLLLKEILSNSGSRFKMFDPTSWPKQAQLAVDGKWEELEQLKNTLKAGK